MKHENESLDRLDGDLYELSTGDIIDMSKVCGVSTISHPLTLSGYTGLVEFNIVLSTAEFKIKPSPDDGTEHIHEHAKQVKEKRQDFINVWKEWKRRNKEQCKCQEQIR